VRPGLKLRLYDAQHQSQEPVSGTKWSGDDWLW